MLGIQKCLQYFFNMELNFLETVLSPILRVAGPLFFLGLQASCVKTALEILDNKSVGSLPLLPFASLATNCVIWTFYGILKSDLTVLVPNVLGIGVGAFCVGSYKRYSSHSDIVTLLLSACLVIVAVCLYSTSSADALGLLGCMLAVLVMGSPLATLLTVIREQNTSSMPFLTSLTTWGNALSWSMYGLLVAHDPMIYGPNLLGLSLASFQLLLFFMYGRGKASGGPKDDASLPSKV